jgi:hypothetical protein
MRINNWRHVPWIVFVVLATVAAGLLYVGNFHPDRMPAGIQLPPSLIQTPTEHHTVGGTPLGLSFGTISLAIFIFAALLSLRKKIPLWRVGTVQRWLRAHIWLTLLTIPLVVLHSGFRLGGPMTTLLMAFYAIVMVSGIYGLFLQHLMPRLMKERLPAETVFEQIPHIRSQLAVAAEKMRDSFKPTPPKKPDTGAPPAASPKKAATAGAAVMASTKGELSTPVARAKSATGSDVTAEPVTAAAAVTEGKIEETSKPAGKNAGSKPPPAANAVTPAPAKAETIGTPTARVQSDPPGAPVPRADVPAGDEAAPSPPVAPATPTVSAEKPAPSAAAPATSPAPAAPATPPPASAPAAAKPAPAKPAAAAKPAPAKPAPPPDPASEAALVEFIDRQILPYLRAKRGDRMRLGNPRFSDDTFRFVKLRVTETYRSRVEEIQAWCDERRMLDLQTRLQHWLHGWLFVHVPVSFLLLMLTIWHAYVTLFYY